MYKLRTVIVTCSLDTGSVERVEKRLIEAGFQVIKVLEFAGSITGHWDRDLKELQTIDEVDAAEESQMMHAIESSDSLESVKSTPKLPNTSEQDNDNFGEKNKKRRSDHDPNDGE